MEAQHGTNVNPKQSDAVSFFSSGQRAAKVENDLKQQVMSLADGSASEYNAIMSSSVEIYLRKFEFQIKQHSDGNSSNRIPGKR